MHWSDIKVVVQPGRRSRDRQHCSDNDGGRL